MEPVKYAQMDIMPILPIVNMNSKRHLSEEEMFVEKEEYLDQYRENNFWVMLPMRKVNILFNRASYQGSNEKIIEEQSLARQRISKTLLDSVKHRIFNDLHRNNCVKLEEKDVITMLQSNVVGIPI